MAPGGKNPLRDKLEEDVLDLSLMQLEEVPVNEIAQLTKGTTLDLSNNLLTYLPDNFPLLSHLVKLDLSKNQISELPEYFGQLRSLKHLDLYSNKLTRLPVGFCHLKSLKWLDLKGNPLVPALAKAAGPCITASDCAKCAKQVVALMQSMSSQLDRERQKHLLEEQKAEAKRRQEEEAERERIRIEKKAAKEKRREEAMLRDGGGRAGEDRGKKRFTDSMSEVRHEMEKPPTQKSTPGAFGNQANGSARSRGSGGSSRGWCASFLMMLMGIAFVTLASGISMLWIYTGGHLDQKSIDRALPMMQKDVDSTMLMMGNKVEVYWKETNKALGPYAAQARVKAGEGWVEFKRRSDLTAHWINMNLGPAFCQLKAATKEYWILAQSKISEGWALLKPKIWELWSQLKPFLVQFAMYVSEVLSLALDWIKKYGPIYGQLALDTIYHTVVTVGQTVDGWING